MAIRFFNMGAVRRPASRDGYAGGSFMEVPFYPGGFYSPSGKILSFPQSVIKPTNFQKTLSGRSMPDTYSKGSSLCR